MCMVFCFVVMTNHSDGDKCKSKNHYLLILERNLHLLLDGLHFTTISCNTSITSILEPYVVADLFFQSNMTLTYTYMRCLQEIETIQLV